MTVAASVNDYPTRWRTLKIVRLYEGRATKERKWRLCHPPMANGDQILKAVFVRIFDQADDVALFALSKNSFSMRCAETPFP
jgi:hypothetical protein